MTRSEGQEPATAAGAPPGGALRERWIVALLVAAVVAVALLAMSPAPVGVYFDDGVYVMLGKALATGQGLRDLNLPGSPLATHFPPGYPALLALLWRLDPAFPANVALFRLANVTLLGAATVLAWRLATTRLGLGRGAAALGVLAGAGMYPAMFLAGAVMSEMLFLVLLLAALLNLERLLETPSPARSVAVGALIGLVGLTRTIGIVVLPAALVLLAWRRRPAAALAVLLASCALLVPWQLWVSAHGAAVAPEFQGNYGPYLPWMLAGAAAHGPAFFLRIAARNAAAIASVLQPAGGAGLPGAAVYATAAAAAIAAGAGAWRVFRRAPATVLSLAAYVLVMLVWPFPADRFVWAVWPLLVLLAVVGVAAVLRWRPAGAPGHVARAVGVAAGVAVVAGHAVVIAQVVKGDDWWTALPRARAAAAAPVVRWVAQHTAATDVVVTDHGLANVVALYTGRKTLPAQDPQADWMVAEAPLTYSAYYLDRLVQRWNPCCVVVVGPPALPAAVRLAEGPAPHLALAERFREGGAAFVVVGHRAPPQPGDASGPQR